MIHVESIHIDKFNAYRILILDFWIPIRPRFGSEMIDSQHLQLYPYCGSMDYKGNNQATSGRVINSKTPKDFYRWTVLLKRFTYQKYMSYCTGTIITDRYNT